jgi:transposase
MVAIRHLGCAAAGAGLQRSGSGHGTNDRLHYHPGASPRSRRKGGIQRNALGRSRGGFTTKVHLRTNAQGLPIGTVLTPGETHDVKGYEALMEVEAPDPKVLLADRGYDANAIREDIEERGATPVIPTKKNRRIQVEVDGAIYALRNRIERCFNRLKNSRRFATRYDKLIETFAGFVQLVSIRLWLRNFVNRT